MSIIIFRHHQKRSIKISIISLINLTTRIIQSFLQHHFSQILQKKDPKICLICLRKFCLFNNSKAELDSFHHQQLLHQAEEKLHLPLRLQPPQIITTIFLATTTNNSENSCHLAQHSKE